MSVRAPKRDNDGKEKVTPAGRLRSLSRRGADGRAEDFNAEIRKKLDEALFFSNMVKNSQTVVVNENEALTRLYTGQKIYVSPQDTNVAPHLMLGGEWEVEVTKLFRQYLRPNDVVLDVGANFGFFGLVADTEIDADKGGEVHFIEANPDITRLIEKTVSVNGMIPYSTVNQIAVSNKPGKVTLHILQDNWGSSSIHDLSGLTKENKKSETRSRAYKLEKKVEVEAVTIDDLAKSLKLDRVSFIKMDIEGFEDKAFEGMKNIVKKNKDLRMFLEFTGTAYDNPKKFFGELKKSFKNLYVIEHGKEALTAISSYKELDDFAGGDWIMMVLANEELREI